MSFMCYLLVSPLISFREQPQFQKLLTGGESRNGPSFRNEDEQIDLYMASQDGCCGIAELGVHPTLGRAF